MIPYVETATSITVILNGKPRTILKTHAEFSNIKGKVVHQKFNNVTVDDINKMFDAVENAEEVFEKVNRQGRRKSKGLMIKIDAAKGEVYFEIDGKRHVMEQGLAIDFIKIAKAKKSNKILRTFITNIASNPNPETLDNLFSFIKRKELLLTLDGHFLAYKGVRLDYLDQHSGQFDNSIGKTVEMPRENVTLNRNISCSSGLHVGTFGYASTFSSKTMLVKVNPKDVVSVPFDYNGSKMRVCKYEVVDELTEKKPFKHEDIIDKPYYGK